MTKKVKLITEEKIEKLLNNQTLIILDAVNKRISTIRIDMAGMEGRIDKKLEKVELRINAKIEKLTDTLDNFLKRVTDMEDEFEIMKADINRMKKIMKEKLGIEMV